MKYYVMLLFFFLSISNTTFVFAQEDPIPSPEKIQEWAMKYQAERDNVLQKGIAKRFLPVLMEKADTFAQRGAAALKAGRLVQAGEAYRQARWQLPYQSPYVPDHVAQILGSMRLRHANEIYALAFSPDGNFLATASGDQTVKIWDLGNGHEVLKYAGHTDAVRFVAFSPDGKSIASAGGKELKIWDPATGKERVNLEGEGIYTTSLVYAPDGKYLIVGSAEPAGIGKTPGTIIVYEASSGRIKRKITDFKEAINSLAFNCDGSIMGAAIRNGQIRLWQYPGFVDSNQSEYWFQDDLKGVPYAIAFSPDNRTLVRLGSESIKIYNLVLPGAPFQVVSPRRVIPQPDVNPKEKCAVFSKDGKTLFTGGTDGTIKQWDIETGQLTGSFKAQNGEVKALAFQPHGNQLASAGADFTVRLWDFDVVRQSRDFTGHDGPVWTSFFSPDGKRLVSASADRTIRIWDVSTGKTLLTLTGHFSPVTVALFSPDGKTILSGSGDKLIKLWDAITGQPLRTFEGHTGTITALDFSKDGNTFVSGSADKTVRVWDIHSTKPLIVIEDNKSIVAALAFSPDDKQIAVGNVDQTIRLYDAATGKQRKSWTAHGIAVSGLSFSPNGQWLASCGVDQFIKIWPMTNPDQKAIIWIGHAGPLSAVAFRADNQHIVSTGSDRTVKLWKIENGAGKEAQSYKGHRDWVTSAAFSKDGYYLVSSGVDRIIKVWEITNKEIPLLAEHTGSVDAVAFSPDDKLIASGASDKTIKIWDRATGKERFTLVGHSDGIQALTFTPDSKTLVSSGVDRNIRLWDVASGKELPRLPGQQQSFTGLTMVVPYLMVSPDGKKLIVWEPRERGTILTGFDLATGTELYSINDQGRTINSVAFSADATRAATGARDGSVRVFDLEKKGTLLPGGDWFLYEKGVGVGDLAFTPDGSILVAGSNAGDVKICRIDNKETLKTIKAHDSRVIACQVTPDGKRFATVGMNNIVKLWDLTSATELRSWNMSGVGQEHGGFVTSMAFSPDSKQLITGNANSTLFVLDLP